MSGFRYIIASTATVQQIMKTNNEIMESKLQKRTREFQEHQVKLKGKFEEKKQSKRPESEVNRDKGGTRKKKILDEYERKDTDAGTAREFNIDYAEEEAKIEDPVNRNMQRRGTIIRKKTT